MWCNKSSRASRVMSALNITRDVDDPESVDESDADEDDDDADDEALLDVADDIFANRLHSMSSCSSSNQRSSRSSRSSRFSSKTRWRKIFHFLNLSVSQSSQKVAQLSIKLPNCQTSFTILFLSLQNSFSESNRRWQNTKTSLSCFCCCTGRADNKVKRIAYDHDHCTFPDWKKGLRLKLESLLDRSFVHSFIDFPISLMWMTQCDQMLE